MESSSTQMPLWPPPKPVKNTVKPIEKILDVIETTETRTQISGLKSFYGLEIPISNGIRMVSGVPIWVGEKDAERAEFAVGLGYPTDPNGGSRTTVRRVWANEKLIIDNSQNGGLTQEEGIDYRFYSGTETQVPDNLILQREGAENTPAFRGMMYMVFSQFDLKKLDLIDIPVIRVELQDIDINILKFWELPNPPEYAEYAKTYQGCRRSEMTAAPDLGFVFEIMTAYMSPNGGDARFFLTVWSDKTRQVLLHVPLRFEDGEVLTSSAGAVTFGAQIVYNPVMQRLILSGQPEAARYTFYMIDPFSGLIEDSWGEAPQQIAWGMQHAAHVQAPLGYQAQEGGLFENKVPAYTTLGSRVAFYEYTDRKAKWPARPDAANETDNDAVVMIGYKPLPFESSRVQTYRFARRKHFLSPQAVAALGPDADRWCLVDWAHVEPDVGVSRSPMFMSPTRAVVPSQRGFSIIEQLHSKTFPSLVGKPLYGEDEVRTTFVFSSIKVNELSGIAAGYHPMMRTARDGAFVVAFTSDAGSFTKLHKFQLTKGIEPAGFSATYKYVVGSIAERSLADDNNQYVQEYRSKNLARDTAIRGIGALIGFGSLLLFDTSSLVQERIQSPTHINLATGNTASSNIDSTCFEGINGYFYAGTSHTFDAVRRQYQPALGESGTKVSTFLRHICLRVGFESSDITISGIEDTYWGSIINTDLEFWTLVNTLARVYRFKVFESEGKIKFVRNGNKQAPVIAYDLTENSVAPLASGAFDAEASEAFQVERIGERNLPNQINLAFIDYTQGYKVSSVYVRRIAYPKKATQSDLVEDLSVPFCLNPSEALTRTQAMLFDSWDNRTGYTLRIPRAGMLAEPGDVIRYVEQQTLEEYNETLQDFEQFVSTTTHLVELESVTLNADWSVTVQGRSFSIQDRKDINVVTHDYQDPVIRGKTTAVAVSFDVTNFSNEVDAVISQGNLIVQPVLIVDESRGLFTSGVVSHTSGAIEPFTVTSPSLVGTASTVLPPATAFTMTDETFICQVKGATDATFPNPTEAEFLAGKYLVAIGKPGRWEVVSYRNAVVTSGGVTLTGLIRARRDTVDAAGKHASGDYVVPLTVAQASFYPMAYPADAKGSTLTLKVQGYQQSDAEARSSTVDVNARWDRPFAPANVQLTRSGTTINITWNRTSKVPTTLKSGVVVPPAFYKDENVYSVRIHAADGTVIRTENGVTGTSFNYTEVMQAADQVAGDILYVTVAQRSTRPEIGYGTYSAFRKYEVR